MAKILYGSKTSPYVRRIRMLLANEPYRFELVNVYENDERAKFSSISPIRKLPVLDDDGEIIFDSGVIAAHLLAQQGKPPLSIFQNNLVNAVNAATDSLIIIMQSKNSGLTIDEAKLFYNLQISRAEVCFDWLEQQAKENAFTEWDYPTMALITLLDWVEFRQLKDLSVWPQMLAVRSEFAARELVLNTLPE